MKILELTENHYRALRKSEFKGFDVFDGLNSAVIRKTPLFRSRLCRLAWIQFFKRSPINFRHLAQVPEGYNAKGLALLIRGLVNLYRLTGKKEYLSDAYTLADIIISQKARDRDYFCAGYNFFWEAKAFSVPEFTPNMIVSTFTGQAFLDLYEIDGDEKWLEYTRQIGQFIEKELLLSESEDEVVFGYVPGEMARVHNVNLMGSSLFARLYHHFKDERYAALSTKSAQYSINSQRDDGAWYYGENVHHRWVDNFHTGFNLVALDSVQKYLSTDIWQKNIETGLVYHLNHHFMDDMTPKYYDTEVYPIDIHNFAQGISTLITFGDNDKARELLEKCIDLMWDRSRHYFYYQKTRWYTNRIDYIRWSQAWMFYSLTAYLLNKKVRS